MILIPSFEIRCRICDQLPTVVIPGHRVENTELCGPCFFGEDAMLDWQLWEDKRGEEE